MRGFSPEALRAARGTMPVRTLARLARVGRSTVHHWESGTTTPQVDVLRKVCELLDVPISTVVQIDPANAYPADLRVLAGLTQPELGREAKLSTATVGYIERGEVELTDSALSTLARALRVTETAYKEAYERARVRPPDEEM
ncbi:helix-turn-helix transcriptional regulator [Gordonia sp. OPL2]|uniref:helix-turn-helix transcriptional regulator n=1 Tax=Gordonia sp. OPL2 TaxID=2486274 RepID=UPI0021CD160E|nr:helix-turn-helix transcriptional regulator [Gordonia sp. OPL2]